MAQELLTNFDLRAALPLDKRFRVSNINERNTINPLIRYPGMIVYVDSEQQHYTLIGGTDNSNWELFQAVFDPDLYYTKTEVDALLAQLGFNTGNAVLDAGQFVRNNSTSVTITDAIWRLEGTEFTDTDTLATSDTPTAGNARWDIYTGDNLGNLNYTAGTEAANPVKPSVPAGEILIWEELRLDDGSSQPDPNPTPAQDFPPNRYYTAVTSSSTNLYAKVFEIVVSGVNNYSFILHYQMPAAASTGSTGRVGELNVNITCDGGEIDTIKMETVDGNSMTGDWVMLETTPTNTIALYHKSTHYWGRVQFRVTFANSLINDSHFISNEVYNVLPSFDNSFNSNAFAGSGVSTVTGDFVNNSDPNNPVIDAEANETESTTVTFDSMELVIQGNEAARTGNILYSFTGAKRGSIRLMVHNDSVEPTFPTETVKYAGSDTYVTDEDNYIWFCLVENTESSEIVHVTISQGA